MNFVKYSTIYPVHNVLCLTVDFKLKTNETPDNRKQDIQHLSILYDSIFSLAVDRKIFLIWTYFFAYTLKMLYFNLSEDKRTTNILIRKCFVILSNLLHQAKKEENTFYLHTKRIWKSFYFLGGLGILLFRISYFRARL